MVEVLLHGVSLYKLLLRLIKDHSAVGLLTNFTSCHPCHSLIQNIISPVLKNSYNCPCIKPTFSMSLSTQATVEYRISYYWPIDGQRHRSTLIGGTLGSLRTHETGLTGQS